MHMKGVIIIIITECRKLTFMFTFHFSEAEPTMARSWADFFLLGSCPILCALIAMVDDSKSFFFNSLPG